MPDPPAKRPVGRPPAIGPNTPDVADRVISAIRGRNTPEAAAAFAGISKEALYDAMRRGRRFLDGRLPKGTRRTRDLVYLGEFAERYGRALGEYEVQTVALIGAAGTTESVETKTTTKVVGTDEAGQPVYATETTVTRRPPDVKHLEWILERRVEAWAPRTRQVITGENGGPVSVEVTIASLMAKYRGLHAVELDEGEVIDAGEVEDG